MPDEELRDPGNERAEQHEGPETTPAGIGAGCERHRSDENEGGEGDHRRSGVDVRDARERAPHRDVEGAEEGPGQDDDRVSCIHPDDSRRGKVHVNVGLA